MSTSATDRPILSVRDLTVTFASERGSVPAVRGVDLDLYPGRTLALVGESGSGKSATATALLNLLPDTARTGGRVDLDGVDLLSLGDRQMSAYRGQRLGMVFQDPLSALTPILSVGRQLADAVRVHQKVSKAAAWTRAEELLELVGIPDPHRRSRSFPHEFSGGMRQRVVIALAIANDPDVIVADEPTTALDVTVQEQVLQVLQTAQEITGAALLLVTHDLGIVAGSADEVAVMYAGRIVEKAGVHDLFERPAMPYTAGLLSTVPNPHAAAGRLLPVIEGSPPAPGAVHDGCPFADRCPAVQTACREQEPALRPLVGDDGHVVACRRAPEIVAGSLDPRAAFTHTGASVTTSPREEVVVRVENLHRSFALTKGGLLRRQVGTVRAVDGVDLTLHRQETLALVGESGSGKSTTLEELMALRAPQAGRIELFGRPVDASLTRTARRGLRSRMQLVQQDPTDALDARLPVFDLLAEPLRVVGASRAAIRSRVQELLDMVGLEPTAGERFPSQFSGGQRQRIGIARALATEPEVLLLDEPVSALDVSVRAGILNLLGHLQQQLGLSYLMVAHDLAIVRQVADRVAVMHRGRIVEQGPTRELFDNPQHPYTRGLLAAIPVPDPRLAQRRRWRTPDAERAGQDAHVAR